jgi:hypothetical protein
MACLTERSWRRDDRASRNNGGNGRKRGHHCRCLPSRRRRQHRPAAAAALNDLSSIIVGIATPVALAVFVASTGIVSIATGVLPRWLGWLSLLLALGLLIPVISWIFWLPFGVWVPVMAAPTSCRNRDRSAQSRGRLVGLGQRRPSLRRLDLDDLVAHRSEQAQ